MATGDAKKAPMSVPRTNEPSGEHFNDLAAFLAGKSSVTLKSNAKKNITGHGTRRRHVRNIRVSSTRLPAPSSVRAWARA